MLDPSAVFIDGTHIKASANKKKFQKEQVAKAAKVYSGQLRREVNAEREKLGKKPIEDENDNDKDPPQGGGGSQDTVEKTVSTTDPDCGMFVKGEHERQFAYEAHTACDKRGFVLGVEVTAGNVHDSVAWDAIYNSVTSRFDIQFVAMDAGYKTPWIAKKVLDDGKVPVLPYTRYKGRKDGYRPWDYQYDPAKDVFICPHGEELRHTTTDREGKRIYRSTPKNCVNCPSRAYCGANEKGQKVVTTHIWQEYLDIAEGIRKTELGRQIYAQRKETIERVFADAKEKHAMRYTHHRGLAAVTRWVRLKYAAMNLKKLAEWSWRNYVSFPLFAFFAPISRRIPAFVACKQGFFDKLKRYSGSKPRIPLFIVLKRPVYCHQNRPLCTSFCRLKAGLDLLFGSGEDGICLLAQRLPQPFFLRQRPGHMGNAEGTGVAAKADKTAQRRHFPDIFLRRPQDLRQHRVVIPSAARQVADGGQGGHPNHIVFRQRMAGLVVQIRAVLNAVNP